MNDPAAHLMNLVQHLRAFRRFVRHFVPALFLCSTSLAGVEISEFMANNDTTLATAEGLYEDWIEIHNDSGAAVDLAGWYLTDNPADLRKWQFPSTPATSTLADDGYLIVFADGSADAVVSNELHASFKLASGGEYLALVEPDGETVADQFNPEFPPQSADVSYGIDSGTGSHAYFLVATPGAANGQAIAEVVQFSQESGTFTSPFNLVLSVDSPTTSIRYTLDGTVPTASSMLYGPVIAISTTTEVRARSFKSGLDDGPVVSETFFHLAADAASFSSELPLVVLDNFGGGAIPNPESFTRQPSQVMIFEPVNGVCALTNSPSVASRSGIRRRGESTGSQPKPNLSLETWGEVDEESRSIKPLGMPAESDWILYAPLGIDTAMMRNAFIYEVSNQAGRYAVRTRFVELFLNDDGSGSITESGDYIGVYVLMEKIKQGSDRVDIAELPITVGTGDPDISGGYIWKKDKIDPGTQTFSAGGKTLTSVYPKAMSAVQLNWLATHVDAIDAAIPNGNYESLIDVESFADHHILNVFANNADGLNFSTFYHKDRDGLVRMEPVWDFDRSMGCDNDARASNPEVWSLATDPNFFFHSTGPLWFRSLALNDPEFWIVWTDRWQAMRRGPLSDAAMDERIERYRAEIANAAERNYIRWPNLLNTNDWSSANTWIGKVDEMKTHVLTRGQWIDDQLIDPPVFNHPGGLTTNGLPLTVTGPETQYYTLDGSDPRAVGGSAAGSSYSSPIPITANTLVQARSWNGGSFGNAPSTWPWSALSEVMLVVEPAPLAITEVMYHPRPPSGAAESGYTASDFEFVEVHNTGGSPCSLVGVQFLDGVKFDFTYGSAATLGAGGYGVVVRNLDAFKARYPNWATFTILGTYTGRLSNRGENLELGYAPTNMLPLVDFDYEDDWYPATDGEGFALALDDPQSAPSSWDNKSAWRPSSSPDGSPGEANPAAVYPQGAVVINEVLSHQDTDNPGDWIELHNTTGSSIGIGGWFLSDSRGDLKKYTIPGGTQIPANGFVVFTEHDHFGAAFALSEHGDAVYLSSGSGGALSVPAYREFQDFGGQERDVTFGRHIKSNGVADFPSMLSPTMGATNSGPRVGPVIIEEIMYHPVTNGHEYISLVNTSGATVDLYDGALPSSTWKVSGIDFVFPPGVQLTAGDSLLLVRDTVTPAQFRSIYAVPASIEIFSYPGALDNDADTIVLKKPGTPEAGTGYLPNIVVEQVKYNDSAPWPVAADGTGKSLHRLAGTAYGNDTTNWQALDATYGPTLATLTVLSGTGGGDYTSGTSAPIQADAAPTNEVFVEWIGNLAGVVDVHAPATTVTMPGQDTTVTAVYSSNTLFIAEDAVWNYHDQGQDLGAAWRALGYNDSGWSNGPAQLGYNEGDEATLIGFGGVASNKHITSYFRTNFTVDDPSSMVSLTLRLLRDDGAVVYINGTEVKRDRMPTGTIDYLTRSAGIVSGAEEDTFFEFDLSPSVLVAGTNVMAVEIHQQAPNSSDVSFAAELTGVSSGVSAFSDGDADGMYDAYEVTHFGSTEAGLPLVDSDGDGVRNVDEFVAGTQPTNAASLFRVEGMDGLELSWTPVSGRVYSVQWTDDLDLSFAEVTNGLPGGSYSDPEHSASPHNFYRVGVELE